MYIEHARELESFAIGRHPFIPRDGLALFEDFFDVSIQPTSRLRSREFSEGRPRAADLVSDECVHKDEGRSRKEGDKKGPKHPA